MRSTIKGENQRMIVVLPIFDKEFSVQFRIIVEYAVGKRATGQ